MSEQSIRVGEIVLDRAQNAPLQVIDRLHVPAGEHEYIDVQDPLLQEYGVDEDSAVFECVFLPTGDDRITTPSKTYDYPEERLVRYPVEAALEEDAQRVRTQIIVEFLADLIEASEPVDQPTINRIVLDANGEIGEEIPSEVLLEQARELAEASGLIGGGDGD